MKGKHHSIAAFRRHTFLIGIALLVAVIARPASATTTARPSFHRPRTAAAAPTVEMVGSAGGIRALAVKQGDLAYISEAALNIVDLHDLAHPVRLGRALLPEAVTSLDLAGDLVYVGTSAGLHILSVSNPDLPARRGTLSLPRIGGFDHPIRVIDGIAYVVEGYTPMGNSINIQDALHPVLLGRYQPYPASDGQNLTTTAFETKVDSRWAYVGVGESRDIVDVANPAAPLLRLRYAGIGSMQLMNGLQYFEGAGITIRRVNPAQLPPLMWLPIISLQG